MSEQGRRASTYENGQPIKSEQMRIPIKPAWQGGAIATCYSRTFSCEKAASDFARLKVALAPASAAGGCDESVMKYFVLPHSFWQRVQGVNPPRACSELCGIGKLSNRRQSILAEIMCSMLDFVRTFPQPLERHQTTPMNTRNHHLLRSLRNRGFSCCLLDRLPVYRPFEIQRTAESHARASASGGASGCRAQESKKLA